MTLVKAKGMQRVALQFWHLGAARKKANREAEAEARRRLHQKLFPSDSAPEERHDGTGTPERGRGRGPHAPWLLFPRPPQAG
jgi:hypothetical protein